MTTSAQPTVIVESPQPYHSVVETVYQISPIRTSAKGTTNAAPTTVIQPRTCARCGQTLPTPAKISWPAKTITNARPIDSVAILQLCHSAARNAFRTFPIRTHATVTTSVVPTSVTPLPRSARRSHLLQTRAPVSLPARTTARATWSSIAHLRRSAPAAARSVCRTCQTWRSVSGTTSA